MCYHCATNPSIHHHHRCIAAVSSPLSHHGVAFAVASLRFRRRHCGVTFTSVMVSLSPSWCRLRVGRGFIVTVVVLPSLSHCHGFIVVVVLPSLSHCRGVVVTVSLSPLRCHLHHRIVTVLSSQSHRCGAFAV